LILVCGIAFILIYRININIFIKILILTGFLFIAGYTTISRDYIVIIFLCFILLTRYFAKQYNYIDTTILVISSLVNVFGLIISVYWMVLFCSELRKNSKIHVIVLGIFIFASALLIKPESQNTFQMKNTIDAVQIPKQIMLIIFDSLTFRASYFLNSNLILILTTIYLIIFISLVALVDKKLLLAFSVSSLLLIQVYLFTPGNYWWHKGMLTTVFLLTSLILYVKRVDRSLSLPIEIVVFIFLLLQVTANFSGQVNGVFSKVYSNSRITSDFLKLECKSNCDYLVNVEYAATPISAYLGGQKLYVFDKQRFSSFSVWDAKVKEWDWTQAAEISKNMDNPLFILNENINPPANFELLAAFEGAVWRDEDYFIYSLVK